MYDQNNGDFEGDEENDEEVYCNEGELCYEDIVYRGDGGGNKDNRKSKNDGGIHTKVAGSVNDKYGGLKERGGVQNPNTRKLYVNQLLEARQSRNEEYQQKQQ